MKIVFVHNRRGVRKTLKVQGWAKVAMSLCVLGLPLSAGLFLGIQLSGGKVGFLLERSMDNLQEELAGQREQIEQGKKQANQQVQALSLKLAEMQAKLVRLDALGERLTSMADLDDGEFNFNNQVPIGGPETVNPPEFVTPQVDLHLLFNELESQIDDRENQLSVLEALLVNRQLNEDISIAGKPVEKGWVSSRYGMRTDPFNGQKSWHKGVDFAGRPGANVVSVGSGVVTWSGPYKEYGNMVEVDHGEGYVTRYAHNQQNSVKVGDLVQRGQVIAMMGSTGRSTGPHLHFEVYKNGRSVDPSSYIRKTLR